MTRRSVPLAVAVAAIPAAAFGVAAIVNERDPLPRPDPDAARLLDVSVRSDDRTDLAARRRLHLLRDPGPGRNVTVRGKRAYVKGQVLVAFEPNVNEQERLRVAVDLGGHVVRDLPGNVALLAIGRRTTIESARRLLTRSPAVRFAEPNSIYKISALPDDPYFDSLWGLENGDPVAADRGGADIDAPAAWEETTGAEGVTVGIIDTGVAYRHPDLDANVWLNEAEAGGTDGVDDDRNGYVDDIRGWDWVQDDASPVDQHGHGTHVAGTVGAEGNNGRGTTGVSWDVSLMPLRALDAGGYGTTADVAAALAYANRAGADVVNASLSGPTRSQTLALAIESAPDTLFVVAAGNESTNTDTTPSYPCSYPYPNVVCVAATGRDDKLAAFSNYGVTSVDLAAPGTRILSTLPAIETERRDGFTDLSGWSFGSAAPWVLASDDLGSFATDGDGDYAPTATTEIESRVPVHVSAAEGCALAYALRLDTEPEDDLLEVEVGSGSTWRSVAAWSGSTSDRWVEEVAQIPFRGAADLTIRFRLHADGDANTGDGVGVDDVSISCVTDSFEGSEFAYYSGTSMASPHVAGAAALLFARDPEAPSKEIAGALIAGAEAVPELVGKVTSGARLDVNRSLHLLSPSEALEEPSDEPVAETPQPRPSEESAGGGGGGDAAPEEEATPADPTPEPTERSPEETSSPSPEESPTGRVIDRRVTLALHSHLVARGRVAVAGEEDGHCRARVVVQILRGQRVIARSTTSTEGRYRVRLRDRTGTYRARVKETTASDDTCASSRSLRSRHVH